MTNIKASKRLFLSALFLISSVSAVNFFSPVALAQSTANSKDPGRDVVVVEASGLMDPVLVRMMEETLMEVDPAKTIALVFQINITGSVIEDSSVVALGNAISSSRVPVSFWIGPSGARAKGPIVELAFISGDIGISPGSKIGKIGKSIFPSTNSELHKKLQIDEKTLNYEEAIEKGIARSSPVLLEHLVGLEGFEVISDVESGEIKPLTQTRFEEMNPPDQFFHSVGSPAISYLLFLAGMGLLVFELYTAGVGIAGVLGSLCLLLGFYGLAVLPSNPWGIALLIFSMLSFAVDVQTGVPRFWSAVATTSLIVGSFLLFDGLSLSWLTLLFGILLTVICMSAGMPAMIRTRFATPTIGREWIIGELGMALEEINPNGTVEVKGAIWKAQTNRATPIKANEEIRVAAVEGFQLDVEPLEGAARDYRERKGSKG
ncbi:MAG: NfeD family protein [Actinomycetota bacterium]|nr:NfeD family protein [Actinomycetota bacterium]